MKYQLTSNIWGDLSCTICICDLVTTDKWWRMLFTSRCEEGSSPLYVTSVPELDVKSTWIPRRTDSTLTHYQILLQGDCLKYNLSWHSGPIHDHELCKNSKFLSLESGSGRLRRRRTFEMLNDLTTLNPPPKKKSPAAPENTYELSEGGVWIKWLYELSECMNYLSENNNKENRG